MNIGFKLIWSLTPLLPIFFWSFGYSEIFSDVLLIPIASISLWSAYAFNKQCKVTDDDFNKPYYFRKVSLQDRSRNKRLTFDGAPIIPLVGFIFLTIKFKELNLFVWIYLIGLCSLFLSLSKPRLIKYDDQ